MTSKLKEILKGLESTSIDAVILKEIISVIDIFREDSKGLFERTEEKTDSLENETRDLREKYDSLDSDISDLQDKTSDLDDLNMQDIEDKISDSASDNEKDFDEKINEVKDDLSTLQDKVDDLLEEKPEAMAIKEGLIVTIALKISSSIPLSGEEKTELIKHLLK